MYDLVSIITPCYNSENYISETIDSVLNQTYKVWELIIIDDCSTDNSVKIIRSYTEKDSRIKLFCLDHNSGKPSIPRNYGLNVAKGNYIAFLDSDDLWYPRKLEIQLSYMISNNYKITFTSYELININGSSINHLINSVKSLNIYQYRKNTLIGFSSSMVEKSITNQTKFSELPLFEDTYFWISTLKAGHIAYGIPDVLMKYRVRNNSISSNKIKAAYHVWKIFYTIERLGFFQSLYYFYHYAFNAINKRL